MTDTNHNRSSNTSHLDDTTAHNCAGSGVSIGKEARVEKHEKITTTGNRLGGITFGAGATLINYRQGEINAGDNEIHGASLQGSVLPS